ncbi:MAG: hypothetical protein ACYDBV_10985 [Nitrospiria bacterium]
MEGQEENPDVPKGFSSLITGTVIPVILFLSLLWVGMKFLNPAVEYKEPTEVKTAPLAQFHEGINTGWRKDDEFYIVRTGRALFVLSAKDKYVEKIFHQEAFVNWIPDRDQFVEQIRGSLYDRFGNAVGGSTRWTLDRLAVRLNDAGEVVVDPRHVQNMDGETRQVNNQYRVEESVREVEPFIVKIP